MKESPFAVETLNTRPAEIVVRIAEPREVSQTGPKVVVAIVVFGMPNAIICLVVAELKRYVKSWCVEVEDCDSLQVELPFPLPPSLHRGRITVLVSLIKGLLSGIRWG